MRLAQPSEQLALLSVRPEFRIDGNAHARNAYGAAAQEIACAALSLLPVPINGACGICFDAADRSGRWYEIKSVHRSGKAVVYDFRLEKEESAGVPVLYVFVVHRVRGVRSSAAMWKGFLAPGLEILVLPVAAVREVANACPLRTVKSSRHPAGHRTGYNRKGYVRGYRNLSLAALRERVPHGHEVCSTLYGESFLATVRTAALNQ